MKLIAVIFPVFLLSATGVVDRIAVTVGNQVITESEVLRDARLTALMNRQPPDLSPEARRAAANRLVDQQLLRTEMEIVNFAQPSPQEVDGMLKQFRREHYPAETDYRSALQRYGVTEDELKQFLEWQLRVMRFTDQRFGGLNLTLAGPEQSADRQASDSAREEAIDQQLDAWLKQQRASAKIDFKQGAFEQ